LSKNNEQLSRILRDRYTGLLLTALPVLSVGTALAQDNSSNLPPVQVDAPKNRATPRQTATADAISRPPSYCAHQQAAQARGFVGEGLGAYLTVKYHQ